MKKIRQVVLFLVLVILAAQVTAVAGDTNGAVVFQTDFGLKDGAVCAMRGVAYGVDNNLHIFDLTHEIPAYDIWEASYRLMQTINYWPAGTVFVSVVDPGVGTKRLSVIAKTKNGQYIVTPDNGTLTFVADKIGIAEVRQIDEKKNRLPGSSESYTFFGRDVYAYTAARLAAGKIDFADAGPTRGTKYISLPYRKAEYKTGKVWGNIPILDVEYGNVWTNISKQLLAEMNADYGDMLKVTVYNNDNQVYSEVMPLVTTFGAVPVGKPLAYYNSMMELAFAVNMGNFAAENHISSGPEWSVRVEKAGK